MDPSAPPDFSLSRGGPFRALLGALGLERGRPHELRRLTLLLTSVAWAPLAVIAAVEQLATGRVEPLLRDLSVHVRLLVALPVLLVAERALDQLAGEVIAWLRRGRLGRPEALIALAERAARRAGSTAVELALLGLAVFLGQGLFWGLFASHPFTRAPAIAITHGPASVWYAWVGFPLFGWLLARVLWRWLIWSLLLLGLARLPLEPEPTHPDRAGGLEILARPVDAFALFAFALTAVDAGSWGTAIALARARASDFTSPFVTLLCLLLVVALGPLLAFARTLNRARRDGQARFGALSVVYSRRFRERWLEGEPGPDLLGTPDIQSLNDLGGGYRNAEGLKLVPFGMRAVAIVVVAALVPVVPLLLTEVPLTKLLAGALRSVVGIR